MDPHTEGLWVDDFPSLGFRCMLTVFVVTIVDETDSLSKVGDYDAERESADGNPSNVSPRPQRPNANLQLQVGLSSPRNGKGGPSPSQQDLNAAALLTEIRSNQATTAGDNRMKLGGTPLWPLKSESEAILLRHYTQNLAIWVSPSTIFSLTMVSPGGADTDGQATLSSISAIRRDTSRHTSRRERVRAKSSSMPSSPYPRGI